MAQPLYITQDGKLFQPGPNKRVHTDEKRLCENCLTEGGGAAGVRLMRCKACELTWYCSAECQKKKWKDHKPICKRYQAMRTAVPNDLLKVHDDLKVWIRRNNIPVNLAGNNALLPHINHLPDGKHLLDTHILHVDIAPDPATPGNFTIISAKVETYAFLRTMYTFFMGEDEYFRVLEVNRQMREATEARLKQKMAGTMYILITSSLVMQVHPLCLTQKIVDERKRTRQHTNWEQVLKDSVVETDQELRRAQDGKTVFRVAELPPL